MRNLYQNFPQTPGVYLMKNASDAIIYIGKAGNLKKRVSSYFLRPQDSRISMLIQEIAKIDYKKTDSVVEALILEAELIKKYSPKYNIKDKDDKSFLYVEITKEEFPRVILVRARDLEKDGGTRFGPYTSASSIRETLKIIRKIFPYSLHKFRNLKFGDSVSEKFNCRPCFDYELGLCPGTCAGLISKKEYLKNIKNIKLFFNGQKKRILKNLEKEMRKESKQQEFEKAEKSRRQIFALRHINDIALISETEHTKLSDVDVFRIEGYDVSNFSGTSAVGSMVVFQNSAADKNEYRKFRIKTVLKSDDVGMLREILFRRFSRHKNDWLLPNLILIDGGKPQVNVAKNVLKDCGLKIPVIGIAKGAERKKNEFIGIIPKFTNENILIKVRNEAHRFAIAYHKKIRGKEFIK